MALTDEELLVQLKVLTEKTSDNANMTYSTATRNNKSLNPDVFSGQNSKIVNAINLLYDNSVQVQADSSTSTQMINTVMGSTLITDNQSAWNDVVEIIKGINSQYTNMIYATKAIFTGEAISQILQVSNDDKGKLLSIDTDSEGKLIIKTVTMGSSSSGSSVTSLPAESITYANANIESLTNVKEAIDYILSNGVNEINWENISNKPTIANGLSLTETSLNMCSGDTIMSSVELMTSDDINEIMMAL